MSARTRRGFRLARLSLSAVVAAMLALSSAGPAGADGDPASDELIAQNVFYPYSSPVPVAEQRRLDADVAAARRAGIELKVALIARPSDLGSVTALYGAPQRYAAFLDTEISLGQRIPLLVVMRDGFGTTGLPHALRHAVLATRPPTADTGAAIAGAAVAAVTRIAAEDSHSTRSGGLGGSGLQTRTILLLSLVLAALLVGGLLVLARVRFTPTA